MALYVDTHLFGSRTGYQCLAKSSGVSSEEDRVLSEFGFGQSSDERFLQGLVSNPTAFARPLPGGRIAITRVLAGPLDDGGRPTLERRSILLKPQDYSAVRRQLGPLLANPRIWSASEFAAGQAMKVDVSGGASRPATESDWLVFDAWVSALERRPHAVVVGSGDGASDAVLSAVASLTDADAPQFSWGVRMLSPIAWVDVMSLSPYGAIDGRRPVFGLGRNGCVNPAVASARSSQPERLPAMAALRPVEVEPTLTRGGKRGRRVASQQGSPSAHASVRMRVLVTVSAVAGILLSLVIGIVLWRARPSPGQWPGPMLANAPADTGAPGETLAYTGVPAPTTEPTTSQAPSEPARTGAGNSDAPVQPESATGEAINPTPVDDSAGRQTPKDVPTPQPHPDASPPFAPAPGVPPSSSGTTSDTSPVEAVEVFTLTADEFTQVRDSLQWARGMVECDLPTVLEFCGPDVVKPSKRPMEPAALVALAIRLNKINSDLQQSENGSSSKFQSKKEYQELLDARDQVVADIQGRCNKAKRLQEHRNSLGVSVDGGRGKDLHAQVDSYGGLSKGGAQDDSGRVARAMQLAMVLAIGRHVTYSEEFIKAQLRVTDLALPTDNHNWALKLALSDVRVGRAEFQQYFARAFERVQAAHQRLIRPKNAVAKLKELKAKSASEFLERELNDLLAQRACSEDLRALQLEVCDAVSKWDSLP
jgi:hypothetical protein